MSSLQRFALEVIPFTICSRRIVQVICVCMVILSSCLTIILICTKSRLWLDLCMHTGWLKKVSCCTVSTAYFFEPPCISNRLVLVVLLSCVFLLLCFLCFHCYCMCLLICVCRILIKITYLLTYFTDIIHGYT